MSSEAIEYEFVPDYCFSCTHQCHMEDESLANPKTARPHVRDSRVDLANIPKNTPKTQPQAQNAAGQTNPKNYSMAGHQTHGPSNFQHPKNQPLKYDAPQAISSKDHLKANAESSYKVPSDLDVVAGAKEQKDLAVDIWSPELTQIQNLQSTPAELSQRTDVEQATTLQIMELHN
ncbi:hypothetical protein K7X08_016628 [Anisodus acutangulus]|uniref:Uncharacterized protein n=1 Tax=Anisodus acutangulus TaxID=402998 RepID=A0A9Q1LE40_9SOLA|nr:hypothetical protein K7X08_016628 [Anisodus acutangulus]